MPRLLLPLSILLVLAAPAAAQAPTFSLTFNPAVAGKPATGSRAARDLPPDPQGAPPVAVLVLALQSGFVADPRGVPAKCTEGEAYAVKCPPNTSIGKGAAILEAALVGGTAQDYTATLTRPRSASSSPRSVRRAPWPGCRWRSASPRPAPSWPSPGA